MSVVGRIALLGKCRVFFLRLLAGLRFWYVRRQSISQFNTVTSDGLVLLTRAKLKTGHAYTRERILILQMVYLLHLARSVSLLLRRGRSPSAFVLVRSMLETFLRMKYLFTADDTQKAVGYAMYIKGDRIASTRKIREYERRHPEERRLYGDHYITPEFIRELEENLQKLKRQFPKVKKTPDLCTVAQEIDHAGLPRCPDEPHAEWLYVVPYWLGSNTAHANLLGLQGFVESFSPSNVGIVLDGDLEDALHNTVLATSLCRWSQKFFEDRMNSAGLLLPTPSLHHMIRWRIQFTLRTWRRRWFPRPNDSSSERPTGTNGQTPAP